MSKLVYGVGFNDGSRPAGAGGSGKHLKEYELWCSMLKRCYSKKYKTNKPTYDLCSVSESFLNYSYFYDWCHEQVGFGKQDNANRQWQLDKDILFVGNKTYSENTCVFVPQEINYFFNKKENKRGAYPLGVSFNKTRNLYQSSCSENGVQKNLGLFSTPDKAFVVYKSFKEALCKQLALKWQHEIDPRLFEAMMKWEVKDI